MMRMLRCVCVCACVCVFCVRIHVLMCVGVFGMHVFLVCVLCAPVCVYLVRKYTMLGVCTYIHTYSIYKV